MILCISSGQLSHLLIQEILCKHNRGENVSLFMTELVTRCLSDLGQNPAAAALHEVATNLFSCQTFTEV